MKRFIQPICKENSYSNQYPSKYNHKCSSTDKHNFEMKADPVKKTAYAINKNLLGGKNEKKPSSPLEMANDKKE